MEINFKASFIIHPEIFEKATTVMLECRDRIMSVIRSRNVDLDGFIIKLWVHGFMTHPKGTKISLYMVITDGRGGAVDSIWFSGDLLTDGAVELSYLEQEVNTIEFFNLVTRNIPAPIFS